MCEHKDIRYVAVNALVWDDIEDDFVEKDVLELQTIYYEEDIDIHRTRCKLCGKIGYYSKAAFDWYEHGIPSEGIDYLH